MALFHLKSEAIERLPEASFAELGIYERSDLQRLLKANVSVVAPEVLVISEEFSEWEDEVLSKVVDPAAHERAAVTVHGSTRRAPGARPF